MFNQRKIICTLMDNSQVNYKQKSNPMLADQIQLKFKQQKKNKLNDNTPAQEINKVKDLLKLITICK